MSHNTTATTKAPAAGTADGQNVDPKVLAFRANFESRSPLDEIIREGARRMLQTAINAEVDEFIAMHSERLDGWNLKVMETIRIPGRAGNSPNAVATQLRLCRGVSEEALVLFTCMDAVGNAVEPQAAEESLTRRLWNRLESTGLFGTREVSMAPFVQFQAFARSGSELLPHEREGVQELFGTLREIASRQVAPH